MSDDPREAAARYRLEREARERAAQERSTVEHGTREREPGSPPGSTPPPPAAGARERAAYVETAIQQAIRRGDFDDLPGAGKPLPGLGGTHDPDWWIRRKIEREQLRGLGPPAIMLRVENAELDDRLDELGHEESVRETLDDFNRRVVEARRQLLGGPPVVTPTHDIEAEVAAWRQRREERAAADARARAEREEQERETTRRARRRRRR